jgi:Domain of unknown function (DUF5642)
MLRKSLVGVVCVGLLASCSSKPKPVDVTKIFAVKSTFGSDYRTSSKGPNDISPQMVGEQKLPPGVTFDPPDCEKLATGQRLPSGTQGKTAAVSADGKGNRLVAIAVVANTTVPYDASLTDKCKHVGFKTDKNNLNGSVDVVDAPQINGVQTSGRHRQVTISARGKERNNELYSYVAYFGDTVVIVDASPMRTRGQQQAPAIDTDRAQQLLKDAVAAMRS